jgi:hypothetical protein
MKLAQIYSLAISVGVLSNLGAVEVNSLNSNSHLTN